MSTWAIIDNDGIVHDGSEDEMKNAFVYMTNDIHELEEIYPNTSIGVLEQDKELYDCDWDGDLKLIEIHETYK
jgi:hypothetical protein